MARKKRYGAPEDKRPTLVEAMLAYHTFSPHALFALLYMCGLSQSDAYRVAFNRFDLDICVVATNASRMMRDHRVQEYLFNLAYAYDSRSVRLKTDFPRVYHRLDWSAFDRYRDDTNISLKTSK